MSLSWLLVPFIREETEPGSDGALQISGIDFALSQVATAGAGFVKRIGDLEANCERAAAACHAPSIDRCSSPASRGRERRFCSRSCHGIDGVATHRYRDFPFVMAPIYWSRFVALFGTGQDPKERPHQDSILITRESPEAFEEPIWQHFFPHLHDPTASQILTAADRNAAFDDFFRLHIQKILLLRSGDRYVSKGNYNLTRIPYLASLFPDALFLVPVRHPLTHVGSLTRQHRLFCSYAAQDERVAHICVRSDTTSSGPVVAYLRRPARDGKNPRVLEVRERFRRICAAMVGSVWLCSRAASLRERLAAARAGGPVRGPDGGSRARTWWDRGIYRPVRAGRLQIHWPRALPRRPDLDAIDGDSAKCWQIVESVASAYGYTMIHGSFGPAS